MQILPGTGRGTSRRLVEGAAHERCNRVGHCINVYRHPPGGDANDAITLLAQEPQAILIPCRTVGSVMRFAFDFDNQPGFTAVEVGDIGPDWMLATKLRPRLPIAQFLPEHRFGLRQVAPEATGNGRFRP